MAAERGPYGMDRLEIRSLVSENYPQIASSLLEPLFEVLRVARGACGGDMDKALIILVMAIRTTYHPDFATIQIDKLRKGEIAELPSLGTNVRSIAESLGAPRETIRRKVRELVEAGWIARKNHHLSYTAHAARELNEVRSLIEQMAVRNFETVAGLLPGAGDRRPRR